MSHFDDIEPIFWGTSPGGDGNGCWTAVLVVVAIAAVTWAIVADHNSVGLCESHGERYVDSRADYTLCEKADGAVVRR